jgi:hydrogenase maturation protease
MGKILFLGIGNSILTDDGAGIKVIEKIKELVGNNKELDFDTGNVNSFRLIDIMEGYSKVVIVDAIKRGGKAGTLYKIPFQQLADKAGSSSVHTIDLATAIKFGKEMRMSMPQEISIYGIEVEDTETFSENLTPEVKKAIPSLAREILSKERMTQC